MIHYPLRQNEVLAGEGKCTAQVRRLDPVEMEELADYIVQRGSTVGRADILSVLNDYQDTIETLLLMGMSINTRTARFRVAIKGVFDGQTDGFDSSRHRIVARVSAGSQLRAAIGVQARVVKDNAPWHGPNPLQYHDVVSQTQNKTLTPGEGGYLAGRLLRFDPADPLQGLFFVAADGSRTRAERILRVKPSEVALIAPALPAGSYKLEVHSAANGSGEVLVGVLEAPLTVS